jgi:hypothetical protein
MACSISLPPRKTSLRLGLHTGLTPNRGSGLYDSAYQKWVTLLGPGAPRPMAYGKWLDFYMHVVWHSRISGVLQIWYRVEGQKSSQSSAQTSRTTGTDPSATASNLALQHEEWRPG